MFVVPYQQNCAKLQQNLALLSLLRQFLQTPNNWQKLVWGTKVCRYNWHSAGAVGWPFPLLKYKYILKIKYTKAILSNSTRKLLWFEITKMLIAV